MFFRDVVNSGTAPALEKMLAFTQAQHRVIAQNVANVDTPGYVTRRLDPKSFQQALRKALDARDASPQAEFRLPAGDTFRQDAQGRLEVTPVEEPPENILFHDGTNVRIEEQMALLAENTMMNQATSELLRQRFEGLLKAIRGRM